MTLYSLNIAQPQIVFCLIELLHVSLPALQNNVQSFSTCVDNIYNHVRGSIICSAVIQNEKTQTKKRVK